MVLKTPTVLKWMRSKRILVVDDYPVFTRTCRRVLVRAGFDCVETAHSAGEARRKFGKFEPAVLLMDVHLDDQHRADGLRLLSDIVAQGYAGGVPSKESPYL
jgi:chemotaxis response regulator CheB